MNSMKALAACILIAQCGGCATSHDDSYYLDRWQKKEYRKGVRAAKTDLRRGVLAYEDIQCEEEEGWRVLWCYRRILKEKYNIDYRVISPSPLPGPVGRANGYQSVVGPIIEGKLGPDWSARIFAEAEAFRRDHWKEVEHLYEEDRKSGAW